MAVALTTLGTKFFLGGFMKKFVALTLALSLGALASPVVADSVKKADGALASTESRGPVKMTDEQMDNVTAGLVTVVAVDVVDINNNNIITDNEILNNLNVAAQAQVAILSIAGQTGRFRLAQ